MAQTVRVETGSAQTPRSSRRTKVFRVLGLAFVAGSLALLLVPTSYRWINGGGHTSCGVPLQALFAPPNEGCEGPARSRVSWSLGVGGIGVAFLAFSGIKRRLRFVGWVALAASPYLMMYGISDENRIIIRGGNRFLYSCGSAIGDLVRRSYSEISRNGGTWGLHPGCGEDALNRLYLTLGVAGLGVGLLGIAAIRQRRAGSPNRRCC